jgi:plasmanylethanolamine desaturase
MLGVMSDPARPAPASWHAPDVQTSLAEPTRGARRALKLLAIGAGSTFLATNGYLVVARLPSGGTGFAVACCVLGLCAADLVSGLVHWAADTYGSAETPIFGGFVGTFRVHHTDQADIARHDVIEANADVFSFSAPVHLATLALVQSPFWLSFAFGLFLASYPSSQLHKWAHLQRRPPFIERLQRWGLLLSPERHALHHAGRHDRGYCITTGWLNALLDRARFFRSLERILASAGIRRAED